MEARCWSGSEATWSNKYPVNEKNARLNCGRTRILLQIHGRELVIVLWYGKRQTYGDKQIINLALKKNLPSTVFQYLGGLDVETLISVLMTHLHFDHACGLTMLDGEGYS